MRTGWRLLGTVLHTMVLLGVALLCAPAAAAVKPALDADDRKKLEEGEVLVQSRKPTDDEGVAARAIAVIDAPPEKVWPVVRDCAHYHEFMPRTKESRLVREEGEVTVCEVEISMPFPLSNLKAATRAVNRPLPEGGFERSWTLLEGTYSRNNGSWVLYPWGDGSRTLAVYEIDANPDISIPDAILRSAQTGTLPDVMEAIRKRVRSR
jgi:ribosome-associated toxin RatA of RatAB toxin-antitoxin module